MKSCFDAVRLLLREGQCDLIHAIERSFLEVYVDLINTSSHDFYYKYLLLRYYEEHREHQRQAVEHFVAEEAKMAGNVYLCGNGAHEWVRWTLAMGKTNLAESDGLIDGIKKELAACGAKKKYKIHERFEMAGKTDMYKREYPRLCGYTHNNLHSILEQFITEESDGDIVVEPKGSRFDPVFILPLADCMADGCRILADTFEQIDGAFIDKVKKHQVEIQRIVARRFLKSSEAPMVDGDP